MKTRALALVAALALAACDSGLPLADGATPPADASGDAVPTDGAAPADAATPATDASGDAAPTDGAAAPDLAGTHSCAPSGACTDAPACGNGCCDRGEWCDPSVDPPVCRCGTTPYRPQAITTGCVCDGTPPTPGACGTGPNSGCA
jgi:hypothetical protein